MIELVNVNKTLGSKKVLDNINYCFEYGRVYGLCGHNGSGKTMLLRMISGLIVPDKGGKVIIDGKVLHSDISFPPSIGIVIENMQLLPQYNAFENLNLLSDIKKTATDSDITESLRNALDSDGVDLIYKIIREEKERGAVVLVATHHKEDLENVCDTILSVSEGRLNEE